MKTDSMAARYDRESWARRANAVRERLAVSMVVGRVVALKKAGAEQVGLCPFHDEKTPSFTVNDRKQFYHCFGCGQHGDAIAFVMARQGLAFPAAVELLEAEGGLRHLQAARPAARRRRRRRNARISARPSSSPGCGASAATIRRCTATSRAARSCRRRRMAWAIPR
jgi:hypothetical protein